MNQQLAIGTYDEALERLHRTGPEFEGWMSNHGPMAVEALARHGNDQVIHRWTDSYSRRLEAMPEERTPIDPRHWDQAFGDPSRLGDWIAYFEREVQERTWDDLLLQWWPRLLPGIAAGATHGVIRTGHAVQALRIEVTQARRAELAQALGYWAARWQAVPHIPAAGRDTADSLVTTVPRIPHQDGGIRDRLAQLTDTPGWQDHVSLIAAPVLKDVPAALDGLVDTVVTSYPHIAHGNPTMLVHAATAPNAVARVLPAIPTSLWPDSYAYAWTAAAAVLAAYLPSDAATRRRGVPAQLDMDEAWDAAVRHGGEHVVKLADTALDVHRRTGDPDAVAAIWWAVELDA